MDERLERALAFSQYRVTIENQRKSLKRRFAAMLTTHYNNGVFLADAETIAFITTLIAQSGEEAVLIDQKGNPIEITDLTVFRDKLLNAYHEATNEYSAGYKKLNKARNVKKAMDW